MSKRSDTWMPFYVGDYMRDTGDLTTVEHGAYLLLIMQAWTRDGLLPDSDDRLRVMTRMTPKEWQRSRDAIMALFVKVPNGYRHKRVDKELVNARATNEQRRAAGLASAQARARQREGSGTATPVAESEVAQPTQDAVCSQAVSEKIQGISCNDAPGRSGQHADIQRNTVNVRSTDDDFPLQRNSRPSPSPIRKKEPSLRSGGDPPPEMDAKAMLWREGIASLMNLTGQTRKEAGPVMGKLTNLAGGDHAMLLGLIREAEIQQPDQAYPWLVAAIHARTGCEGTLFGPAGDPWGIRGWASRQPDVIDTVAGPQNRPCRAINGRDIEATAAALADAAGLPETWRGNWDDFGEWLREDIDVSEAAVLKAVRNHAAQVGSIGSMGVFSTTVRGASNSRRRPH